MLAARGGNGAGDADAVVPRAAERHLLPAGARSVRHNLPLADMRAPVLGPELPGRSAGAGAAAQQNQGGPARNHRSGHVEGGFWAGSDFDRQFNAFEATGAAVDPARGVGVVGAAAAGVTAEEHQQPTAKRQKTATQLKREAKERREREAEAFRALDPSVPLALTSRQPWAEREPQRNVLTDEQKAFAEEHGLNVTRADRKAAARASAAGAEAGSLVPVAEGGSTRVLPATSVFHGREQVDYQGRSWLQPSRAPGSRRAGVWEGGETCSLPRRVVATLQAHGGGGKAGGAGAAASSSSSSAAALGKAAAAAGKGVNCIRYFPRVGHLLLSAGLDGKVKIWDVSLLDGGGGAGGGGAGGGAAASSSTALRGKCMRTYLGHSKGVRDVNFSPDGTRFASVGYDRVVRVWDTETGKALSSSLSGGKQFYCAVFHPERSDVLMGGCADKKIYQWDLSAASGVGGMGGGMAGGGGGAAGAGADGAAGDGGGLVAQEYNYHLAAVNTVTFFDGGRRFVSSSDDKTLRVWEFGIPVQIKYVADPAMHAVPAACARTLPDENSAVGGGGGGGGGGGEGEGAPSGLGPADGSRGRLFPTHVVCQSLDNQVLTYSCAEGRFKASRKKTFRGHSTAGYACAVDCSPDGRYVASGDAEGRAFVWEWGNPARGPARTLKAHEGSVCIGAAWCPSRSQLATCGWDGLVKIWE
jgi:pre-mRNA-processing factor 17